MLDPNEEAVKEIIKIAQNLKWITPQKIGYPTMQLSEVEKCMLAMVNVYDLDRMRGWEKDLKKQNFDTKDKK